MTTPEPIPDSDKGGASETDPAAGPHRDRGGTSETDPTAGPGTAGRSATPRERPSPPKPPRWRGARLLRESHRSVLSALVALAVAVPVVVVRSGTGEALAQSVDSAVIVLAIYLPVYLVVTCWAFVRAPAHAITRWAEREGRGTWLQRYVYGTAPGPGVAITVSTIALAVSVIWLPRGSEVSSTIPEGARLVVGVLVLISAWTTVMVSFAVAYHADNLLEDGAALDFPGSRDPRWSDYIYFAVSVSTTFGPTDVTVRSWQMRRTVTVHSILAFVFNTVILAGVVGFLVAL